MRLVSCSCTAAALDRDAGQPVTRGEEEGGMASGLFRGRPEVRNWRGPFRRTLSGTAGRQGADSCVDRRAVASFRTTESVEHRLVETGRPGVAVGELNQPSKKKVDIKKSPTLRGLHIAMAPKTSGTITLATFVVFRRSHFGPGHRIPRVAQGAPLKSALPRRACLQVQLAARRVLWEMARRGRRPLKVGRW